jgi:mannose-1-phosphate guanylyltransferase
VIVSAHHADLAGAQLRPYPGVELVVQPKNLDTAPGILLPLVRILVRSFCARVVFLPSDHYIPNPEPLHAALRAASQGALADRLVMVGVAPTGPEVEYGWIVRGRRIGRTAAHEVERFQEKPSAEAAEQLWNRGGLWNTFIQAGSAQTFWDLARAHLPAHAAAFERYAVAIGGLGETAALEAAYALPAANFSRDVLAHARDLAVAPVSGSGWSDWGSPARVFASLEGTPCHERLVDRIRGAEALAS